MANLIEQMNVLKGLDDASLQGEMQAPSGSAPPFLVLTEIGRRKDMRQRYEAEKARQKPSTTVAEDLSFGLPAQPAAMQGGIGDAVGATPPVQGFASGGLVDAAGYSDVLNRFNTRLDGLDGDKDRARALALLAASGAILGGNSSNLGKNAGAGISAFAGSYGDALKTIDSEEIQLLRGVTDLEQLQQNFANSEADRALRQEEIGISRERLTTDKTPADILKFDAFKKMSPEDQAEYLRLNPPYNPNALNNDQLIGARMDAIYQDAQKKYPVQAYDTPEVAAEKLAKAQAEAYNRNKAAYGAIAADEWLAGMGLSPNDTLVGGTPGAVLDEKDPLGLGL